MNKLSEYICFNISKTILHKLLLLIFKIVGSPQCIIKAYRQCSHYLKLLIDFLHLILYNIKLKHLSGYLLFPYASPSYIKQMYKLKVRFFINCTNFSN